MCLKKKSRKLMTFLKLQMMRFIKSIKKGLMSFRNKACHIKTILEPRCIKYGNDFKEVKV